MQRKYMLMLVDDDMESPYKVVQTYLFFLYKVVSVFYHSPNTTNMPPWGLLCDVIWAPLECNTTSESPYDVIEHNSSVQGVRNLQIG